MNNDKIFCYLNGDKNTKLASLSKGSQLEILELINKYYLELRDNINIGNNDTFGFEMEAECFRYDKIYRLMYDKDFDLSKWVIKPDNSLYKGFEVVTPILNKDNINWNQIEVLCDIIKQNSKIGMHAASHIHIGSQILNNSCENVKRFVLLWIAYQHIIFRFGYGEFLNERPRIVKYAIPNAISWSKTFNAFNNINELSPADMIKWLARKNEAINLTNVTSLDEMSNKNTIEFRLFNYTLNPIIWQNNYNLAKHLLEYCNNDSFNYDIIRKRVDINKNHLDSLDYFRKLDIEGVIELSDLIFDKNIDKVYFLRQYLKNMDETDNRYLICAKQFTKIK